MISFVVKMNRIIMFLISFIIIVCTFLIVVFVFKQKKETNPERYLKSLGYEIEYISEKEVQIPEKFGEGLKEYNKLQKKQGFNLKKFSGKNCIQKQFYVSSKKIHPEKYIANMFTYKNKLIGGDLHSLYYKQKPLLLKSIK